MDKKFTTVLLVIALLIPSFVAIGYYSSTKHDTGNPNNVSLLTIEDMDGTRWSFASDDDNADSAMMISLFLGMKDNATAATELPEAMADTGFFKVTSSTRGGVETIRQYYFTDNPAYAYVVDANGSVYKISETDAAQFLSTKYSVSVYQDNSVPQLIVGGSTIIQPASAVWSYKTYDGTFASLDTSSLVSGEQKTCSIEGGFGIGFTETPDYVTLKIVDGENVLFDGPVESYDDIASLSLEGVDTFTVTVSAQWYENEGKNYYGSANYTFIGDVVEQPTFYLGESTIQNGQFVVIGGKNVSDVSKITFTSEPSIRYTPQFYAEGDYVFALVPISYDLETGKTENYTFTIKYGGFTQNMTLTVTSYEYKSSSSSISKAVEAATYNDEARNEAETILRELALTEALDTHAFSGTFLEDVFGANSGATISPGFGRKITVTATGTQYQHTGCDYNVKKGTDVYAVNAGKVVYSAHLAATGYIVVIDHGWGLKSWYCHLSECSVEVGATVAKGDLIGKAGDTGFTAKNRTHIGLTVGDVPVCIYSYWDKPVTIPSFE